MSILEIVNIMSSKSGDELFEKVTVLLDNLGITVYNADGTIKDVRTVIYEVAEVWNKRK